jgi:protoheme IX farnesyltransferase
VGRTLETATAPSIAIGPVYAYINLAKPKAVLPHFVTAAAAMVLATGGAPPVSTLVLTLLGGGCVAAAANTLNCVVDRDIDALMARTRNRPLPSGLISPKQALAFAAVMGLAGVATLEAFVNRPAAVLAVLALAYYVLAYTLWLKRRTYWSAIIGSAIGAIPPLIGWVAVTDRIGPTPFLLSGVVILWTLPHFWALAVFRRDEYAKAGLRILPEKGVGTWMVACSLLLMPTCLLLVPVAGLGGLYFMTASLLGGGLVYLTARMNRRKPVPEARRLYAYSILYIAVVFGAMIIDRMA